MEKVLAFTSRELCQNVLRRKRRKPLNDVAQ